MPASPQVDLPAAELPTTYCVVGAGPGGLIAARALRRAGIAVEILERYHEVGGIWNIDHPGSPLYESCNFIASSKRGGFIGYPMPADYPDYPTWQQIRDYIHAMADAFDLRRFVTFCAEVVAAEPVRTAAGTYWTVRLADGRTRDYRGIVYAGGHEWKPNLPDLPGTTSFAGRIIHSKDYRSTSEFDGRRVLVVGAGNSGVDIATDAAFMAEQAYLSTRRGYWFLPKQVFGVPITEYLDGSESLPDHPMLEGLDEERRVAMLLAIVGDLTRFGLPAPDHPVTATHPIVNNNVLHYLAHARLAWVPDVVRLTETGAVFADGTEREVDTIVFATGYDIEIPWLPEGAVEYRKGRPVTHLATFFPGLENFYAVGIQHAADHGYQNFDEFAQLVVADARATLTGRGREAIEEIKNDYRPDLKAGTPFVNTRRNENQWSSPALRTTVEDLRKRFGIEIPEWDDQEFYRPLLVAANAGRPAA
ncbi:NAD(P)-binding domain-containing protein [Streptomyces sp. NPDC051954]|uniref:flavin-containing monooxygenase n=1 Tax=unclassified Streptomyces TaxID=2593676 RepID=UPI003421A212